MKKAIIIDDYESARTDLKSTLANTSDDIEVVGEASNVDDGIKLINRLKPTILFLDIELKNELIFKLFEYINYADYHIIFVTAYDSYALKAFEFNALDYLLKPVEPQELTRVLERLKEEKPCLSQEMFNQFVHNFTNSKPFSDLGISTQNGIVFVNLEEIICIEGDRNYSQLYTAEKKHILSKSLSHYEEILPQTTFYRAHKSYLVNLGQIESCKRAGNTLEIMMKNGKEVPVSRRKKNEFMDLLKNTRVIID